MIYFMQSAEYVKIGFCRYDPMRRLEKLQIGNPITLKLLALMDGDMAFESHLHTRFHKQRVRGEWFRLDTSIRKFIAEHAVDHDEVSRARPERRIGGVPAHVIYAFIERGVEPDEAAPNPMDRVLDHTRLQGQSA